MVSRGEAMAHQLSRGLRGFSRSQMLCQRQEKLYSAAMIGQHIRRIICEQIRRDSVPQVEQHCERSMAIVYEQRHNSDSRAPPKYPGPTGIPPDTGDVGSTRSGHVCLETDHPTGEVLQLETRPRGRSHGCIQSRLDQPPGEGLCQPPMAPCGQSSEQSTTETHTASDSTSLEEPAVVPNSARVVDGLSTACTTEERSDHPDSRGMHARGGSQLAAWLISGYATRTRKFQRKAQSCSWPPGGGNHHDHMTHTLGSGWTGVMNGTPIPFLDL